MFDKILANIFLNTVVFCKLIIAVFFAWNILAKVDFNFSWAYELLNINSHVEYYAPLNCYKPEFKKTTFEERKKIFSQIVCSINNNGNALDSILYELPNGRKIKFLTKAEVIHLKDVSNIINILYKFVILCILVLLVCAYLLSKKKEYLFSYKNIFKKISLISFSIVTSFYFLGFEKIFYWFHTKIFPAEHKWFFYYQDSLMVTLMKAPDIFGFIAIELFSLTAFIFAIFLWAGKYLHLRPL
jgi:hypothetical protein